MRGTFVYMIQSFHSVPKSKHFKNQSYHSMKEVLCFLLLFLLFLTLANLEVVMPSTLYLREEVADSTWINDMSGPDHRGGGIHNQHSDKLPGREWVQCHQVSNGQMTGVDIS